MDFLKQFAKNIFQYEARLILNKYKPKIIVITGSIGKSLTKEAIYLVLSKHFYVRKSEKSFTTGLGVPLAIIGCSYGTGGFLTWFENIFFGLKLILFRSNYPEWLILEVDNDKPGDLRVLSSWLQPDILVMSAIGEVPSHVEYFGSVENFLLEKKEIIRSIKNGGKIIYNSDDSVIRHLLNDTSILSKKISCGVYEPSGICGSVFEVIYSDTGSEPVGMNFTIKKDDFSQSVKIMKSVGIQNEYASLLSFAVGLELGIEPMQIANSLNKFIALPGRMNIVSGINNSVIIDDSYNSSPSALHEAIKTLVNLDKSTRRILVAGDMMELGKYSSLEHKKIAELVMGKVDIVFGVGVRSRRIVDELLNLGFAPDKVHYKGTSVEAGEELARIVQSGDVILVKGSQIMRMERTVLSIMANPEKKKKILVRQEDEWLIRD
ncbi:MAG: UDP-N-acetylmuramoyl-tripeptide--D-alanyl-D-alanine ligase [Parcubacteria group bacterium]